MVWKLPWQFLMLPTSLIYMSMSLAGWVSRNVGYHPSAAVGEELTDFKALIWFVRIRR